MIAIVIVGAPGSGKTSLSKAVAQELSLFYVGSGEIARSMAEYDKRTKDALVQGSMAPELAMRQNVTATIEAAVAVTGDFVIDGFPRDIEQLFILESLPHIQPLYFMVETDPLLCLRRIVARKRAEDHADSVAMRWRTYIERTMPMIEILGDNCWRLVMPGMTIEKMVSDIAEDYRSQKRENTAVESN